VPVPPAAVEVLSALAGVLTRWGPWYLFGLDISGLRVPTITPEDLMVAKILAGRPKDIEDARGLWRARGSEMDAERIATLLLLLEEALAQSDLTPVFGSIRGQRKI
jgi:hypothetical protein